MRLGTETAWPEWEKVLSRKEAMQLLARFLGQAFGIKLFLSF